MCQGCVYLIGAGPGDPELLTVKALRLMQSCDVVVLDRLVGKKIQELIPVGATRIFAGKQSGYHHMNQDEINDLLLRLARSGRQVVRLKGGDPFLFGRGAEEAAYLARHDVRFEVVPGITAAAGCSAYAGIPLTHRSLAHGVRFISGHAGDHGNISYDWSKVVDPDTTLVIYMGLATLAQTVLALIAAGQPADTPAAAIQDGTTDGQRRVLAALSDLPARVRRSGLASPTLIVVGRVVGLARQLDWRARAPVPPGIRPPARQVAAG